MKYSLARDVAIQIGEQLMPLCDRVNIAGSIRRGKAEVKDIELIVQPSRVLIPSTELFAPPVQAVRPAFTATVASLGQVIKGKSDGRYMQIALHQGVNLDLFMPDPVDYYRQYAIRTGSAEYSQYVIAGGWKSKGWCGSDHGLRLQSDCQERISGGKKSWLCVNPNGERPPVFESEEHFFDFIGVPWIHPKLRNL